jgi:phosphoserine phosphatase RsbX
VTETLRGVLEWGVATQALEGESESGDLHVVIPQPRGARIVAIDGLGHGPDAATAAKEAAEIVSRADSADLIAMFAACHRGLKSTRGVVMSAADIHAERHWMEWMGIGNIEGTLLRADGSKHETIMLFGGVAGHQMPRLRPSRTDLHRGDTLILATDGVRSHYATGLDIARPAQELAEFVLRRDAKGNDDALVLVARYLGRR